MASSLPARSVEWGGIIQQMRPPDKFFNPCASSRRTPRCSWLRGSCRPETPPPRGRPWVEELPQHPHLLQDLFFDQQLFAAGAGPVDVDRREDALLVHAPVEVNFHVAGALELLVDHVVHARARVDEGGGEDGER